MPRITDPIKKLAFASFKGELSRAAFEEHMEELGWIELDFGAYASVYGNKSKPYILKKLNEPDMGYETYVRLIHRHPNKHFPIISDMKKLRFNKDNYYVYLIEKLYRIPYRKGNQILKDILNTYEDLLYLEGRMQTVISTYLGKSVRNNGPSKFLRDNPSLIEAIYFLAHDSYDDLDFHDENIMQRANGTIVITDPYV